MKKYFIMAVAVLASLTACQQEEPQTVVQTREISFAPAATQTRATAVKEYTIDDLIAKGFAVWGYVQAEEATTWDALFENTLVTQTATNASDFNASTSTKVWQPAEASAVKYWAPSSDYIFSAIYPKDKATYTFGTDKLQTIADFTIVDGGLATEDLLVSQVAEAELSEGVQERVAVGLTFDHMLARVRFQFTNTFADENVTIEVRNVTLHGAIAQADATISDGLAAWVADANIDPITLDFQDKEDDVLSIAAKTANDTEYKSALTEYRLFIPTNVSEGVYKLTFDLAVLADGVTVLTKSYKVDGVDEAAAVALKEFNYVNGKSYLFNANISGDLLKEEIFPIQFDVKVTDWAADEIVDTDIMD